MVKLKGLPQCVNATVIDEILKTSGLSDCDILSVDAREEGDKAGDHYLSEIVHFSVLTKINHLETSLNFVVKDMGKGLSDFIVEVKGVEKEVGMYRYILPEINKLLEDPISPRMYHQPNEKCIILNDLSPCGYRTYDRTALLDYEHCKFALTTLAKLHAASIKFYETKPDTSDVVARETVFTDKTDSIPYYFAKMNVKTAIKMIKKMEGGLQFADSIETFYDTFWVDAKNAISTDFGFNVLNHGDFWTTNILYRYESEEIVDCKLIDFQITRRCSPTYDLFQFITISMKPSVRDNKLDDLLNIYVDAVNGTLLKLGCSIRLTKQNLDFMMNKTKVLGILNALVLTQIALCDPKDPLNLSEVTKSDFREGFPRGDPYEKGYTQKPVQNHILSLLHFFRKKRYI